MNHFFSGLPRRLASIMRRQFDKFRRRAGKKRKRPTLRVVVKPKPLLRRLFSADNKRKSNNPRLITPIGRFLDNVPYWVIALAIVAAIAGCACYFHITHTDGAVTNKGALSWADAFYFSIVTFTSLGYGEIHALGHGREAVEAEVLFGLISIAAVVGKLASERQSALLLLNYTSEQQRRITEFISGVQAYHIVISKAFADYSHSELFKVVKKNSKFISSITNHLILHANEGRLTYSGNTPSLRKLYKSVTETQLLLYQLIRTDHVELRTVNYAQKALKRINIIGVSMVKFYRKDAQTKAMLNQIEDMGINIQNWNTLEKSKVRLLSRTEFTDKLLERVRTAMPLPPWDKDIDKTIALQLDIENKMATRCINELVDRGHWPGITNPK